MLIEGHLVTSLHAMSYLREKDNCQLTLDAPYPDIDVGQFNNGAKWKDFYVDVSEPKPSNAPKVRGRSVDLRAFVHSDHAGDKSTRRLHTRYLIYLNNALIT